MMTTLSDVAGRVRAFGLALCTIALIALAVSCSDNGGPIGVDSYEVEIDFVIERGHPTAPFSMAPSAATVELYDAGGERIVRSAGVLVGAEPELVRVTATISGQASRTLSGTVELSTGTGPWAWVGGGIAVGSGSGRVEVPARFYPGPLAAQVVESLILPDTIWVSAGDTAGIDIELDPAPQGVSAVFAVSGDSVARAIDGGRVVGLQPGSAILYVAAGPALGSAVIMVESGSPETVTITPSSVTLSSFGATANLEVVGRNRAGDVVPVAATWVSRDEQVASVDAEGVVTAVGNGTTRVTVTDGGGAADSAAVTVAQAVARVEVSPSARTLTAVGDTAAFSAVARDDNDHPVSGAELAWASLAPEIATVDAEGLAVALRAGSASIVATHASGAADTAQVSVAQIVAVVEIAAESTTLESLGDTLALTARARDSNDHEVPDAMFIWVSTNEAVATVDTAGLVTSIGNGSAAIIARHADGPADTVTVIVSQVVTDLVITPATHTFPTLGSKETFIADARDAREAPAPSASITWTSLDLAVVTVDADGLVTSVANGTTQIIAVAESGVADTATVTVEHVPPTGLIPLQDDWMSTERDSSKWHDGLMLRTDNPNAIKTQGNGELHLWADTVDIEPGGYSSVGTYDFTDRSVFIERREPRTWVAEFEFVAGYGTDNFNFMRVGLWGTDKVFFQRRTDQGTVVDADTLDHDPVGHRFIRFGHRSADDRLVLWMSPTGTEGSWVEVNSLPRGPLDVTAMRVELQIRYHGIDEPVVLGGLNVVNPSPPD